MNIINHKKVRPIFIFSLPRAGSTLLQRILSSNKKISTSAEPWILLPFVYSLKEHGVIAEYKHHFMAKAISEFCSKLPNGAEDYFRIINKTVEELYSKVSDEDSVYFLDKTPRYTFIIDEVINIFPEAKVIFLWRNPLAISASMMETWGEQRWCLHRYHYDLFDGLSNLVRAYQIHKKKSACIQYERLLKNPLKELTRIMDYLELDYEKSMVHGISQKMINGSMGDPTGTKKYSTINREPIEKWHLTMRNPIRKSWCKRYLRWLGEARLNIMGYDMDLLINEVQSIKSSYNFILSDLCRLLYGKIYHSLMNINIAANTGISGLKRYREKRKKRLYKT